MYEWQINNKQQEILNLIKDGQNLVVQGYAGFGKTTLALRIAELLPDKQILLLTYNRELMEETREKIKQAKLKNITCSNFHSYFYSIARRSNISPEETFKDDTKLLNYLQLVKSEKIHLDEWDFDCPEKHFIILDEFQDAKQIYLPYINKIIEKGNKQVLVMGDKLQEIYGFNDSDWRFLEYFPDFFPQLNFQTNFCNVSMRISTINANFINYCLFRPQYQNDTVNYVLDPTDDGKKLISNCTNEGTVTFLANVCENKEDLNLLNLNFVKKWIAHYVEQDGINELAILVPQRDKHWILDHLKDWWQHEKNWPFLDNVEDKSQMSIQNQKNKILISTIHKFKGRERKNIIFFDFSQKMLKKDKNNLFTNKMLNLTYVGITRAKNNLLLIETIENQDDKNYGRFPWLPGNQQLEVNLTKIGVQYVSYSDEEYPAEMQRVPQKVNLRIDDRNFDRLFLSLTKIAKIESVPNYEYLFRTIHPANVQQHKNTKNNCEFWLPNQINTSLAFSQNNWKLNLEASEKNLVNSTEQMNSEFLAIELLTSGNQLNDNNAVYQQKIDLIDEELAVLKNKESKRSKVIGKKGSLFLNEIQTCRFQRSFDRQNKLRILSLERWLNEDSDFPFFYQTNFSDYDWLDSVPDSVFQILINNAKRFLKLDKFSGTLTNYNNQFIRLNWDKNKNLTKINNLSTLFEIENLNNLILHLRLGKLNNGYLDNFYIDNQEFSWEQKLKMLFSLFILNYPIFQEHLQEENRLTEFPKIGRIYNFQTTELCEVHYEPEAGLAIAKLLIQHFAHSPIPEPEDPVAFSERIQKEIRGIGLLQWLDKFTSSKKS